MYHQGFFLFFGKGLINTFILGLLNISSFGGIVFLYFLPPLLKNPAKFKKVAITSVVISILYLLFVIATLLFVFSFFTNVHEVSPLYNAARYIEFGSFFQRLESIFLLIWIMIFTCYLSISLKFTTYIFQKVTLLNDTKPLIYMFGLLLFGIALLPNSLAVSQYYETDIYPYLTIGITMILSPIILIFANLFYKRFNIRKVD